MKKITRICLVYALALAVCYGCTTTKSTVTPGVGGAPPVTNIVVTSSGIDVAEFDAALLTLISNTPAAIQDAAAISAIVNGSNSATTMSLRVHALVSTNRAK